jgi:hypothetical protein
LTFSSFSFAEQKKREIARKYSFVDRVYKENVFSLKWLNNDQLEGICALGVRMRGCGVKPLNFFSNTILFVAKVVVEQNLITWGY